MAGFWVVALLLLDTSVYVCGFSIWSCVRAGNNSRSSDIVRPNFEYVRPISHFDRTWCPNISPTQLTSSPTCSLFAQIDYLRYIWEVSHKADVFHINCPIMHCVHRDNDGKALSKSSMLTSGLFKSFVKQVLKFYELRNNLNSINSH